MVAISEMRSVLTQQSSIPNHLFKHVITTHLTTDLTVGLKLGHNGGGGGEGIMFKYNFNIKNIAILVRLDIDFKWDDFYLLVKLGRCIYAGISHGY